MAKSYGFRRFPWWARRQISRPSFPGRLQSRCAPNVDQSGAGPLGVKIVRQELSTKPVSGVGASAAPLWNGKNAIREFKSMTPEIRWPPFEHRLHTFLEVFCLAQPCLLLQLMIGRFAHAIGNVAAHGHARRDKAKG